MYCKVGIGTITTTTADSVERVYFPCLAHIRSHTYLPANPSLGATRDSAFSNALSSSEYLGAWPRTICLTICEPIVGIFFAVAPSSFSHDCRSLSTLLLRLSFIRAFCQI